MQEFASRPLQSSMSDQQIASITDLSLTAIQALRAEATIS